jgi:cyclophilin family peptidyl-prolyl cis-trans isomerase
VVLRLSNIRLCTAAAVLSIVSPAAFAVDLRICTTRGAIDVELDERRAPLHAANFVRYAESGFYDGTILHRAVPGSMVQGGSYNLALERRAPGNPVANEAGNGLSNRRGTIAASRSEDPNSATSQFFFNLSDNTHLDARPGAAGFTVFGRVTAGLEVLDAVASLPTGRAGTLDEVPRPLVAVEAVTILDRAPVFGISVEPDPRTLEADFEQARSRGDAAGILRAVDALRQSCIDLDASQRLAEVEAADTLGLTERSRYARERYMTMANAAGPSLPVARQLPGALPEQAPTRDIEALVAHCRRPVAPSVPDGRFTELATMQAVEGAVLRFRQLGEQYLDCVARVVGREDLVEAETVALTKLHNEIVIEITAVLTRFNQAVRAFKRDNLGSEPLGL